MNKLMKGIYEFITPHSDDMIKNVILITVMLISTLFSAVIYSFIKNIESGQLFELIVVGIIFFCILALNAYIVWSKLTGPFSLVGWIYFVMIWFPGNTKINVLSDIAGTMLVVFVILGVFNMIGECITECKRDSKKRRKVRK